jgi:hypothetical protein
MVQETLVFFSEAIKPPDSLKAFHAEEIAREKKIAAVLTALRNSLKQSDAKILKRSDPQVVEAIEVLKKVKEESNLAWKSMR